LFTDTPPLHQPIGWVRHPSNLNLGWAAKFAFDHLIDVKRHPHLHAARAFTAMLAETVLLGLAFWITVARRAGGSDHEWAHISLWIVTVTMIAPLFWSDFLDCFVVYFVVFSAAFWRGRASRFSIWTCFGAYLTAIASAIFGSHSVSVFIRDTMFRGHVHAYNWLGELLFVSVLLTWISAWSLAREVSSSDTTIPRQSRRIRLSRISEASA
jgi:hypothetical protein